jgi:hypothetical protein
MRFAFFRPNDLREAVRVGTASGVVWEKNAKVAVLRRSYAISTLRGNMFVPVQIHA